MSFTRPARREQSVTPMYTTPSSQVHALTIQINLKGGKRLTLYEFLRQKKGISF